MKKSIIINATGNSKWIGGLYYKRNMAFVLLQNKEITTKYRIVIITEKENVELFDPFKNRAKIITIKGGRSPKCTNLIISIYALISRGRFVFPFRSRKICDLLGIRDVAWIPDFQELHYPEFFSEDEIKRRNSNALAIGHDEMPLVLSSESCLKDYATICPEKSNVYVVPFVSYIEDNIKSITNEFENAICGRYGLEIHNFVLVSNQFWAHKNHMIVLEALEYLESVGRKFPYPVVFTGKISFPAQNDYEKKIILKIEKLESVKMLGFMERTEQLALMKAARFIIQPSLFEGWGTVLEDAKVLGKTVLLSDICVHREQKNEKCILFDPNNPRGLGELMERQEELLEKDDIKKGIEDMYQRARDYSQNFAKLINECGNRDN